MTQPPPPKQRPTFREAFRANSRLAFTGPDSVWVSFGDARYPRYAWWVVTYPNRYMLALGFFSLLLLVIQGVITWTMHPRTSLALIGYGLVVLATVVKYFRIAVADSKSGSSHLSKTGLIWFVVGVALFFVPLIVAIIWYAVTS